MARRIVKILNRLVKDLTKFIEFLNRKYLTPKYEFSIHKIAEKDEFGVKLQQVKPHTIERIFPLKIYGVLKGGYLDIECAEQYFTQYSNATVYPLSDFIIVQNKAVWDKYYNPVFTKNIPMDRELMWRNQHELYIKPNHEIVNFDRAFSLCGVHSDVWSHFMIQYLPKLYYSTGVKGLYDKELTILVPEYNDKHLIKVLHSFVEKLPNVKLCTLKSHQVAHCTELINMESATQMIDNESYVSYVDMVIPQLVADLIKTNLVAPLKLKYKIQPTTSKHKIYIKRNNSAYRNLINTHEIEHFFKSEGFTFIEPHLLSFEQKIELFYNAEIVVGPNSAGFSNLIFSQPKTKVLTFANLQRSFEPYLSFFAQNFDLNFLTVTGDDENAASSHSSYSVPLEKVKAAYNYLIESETN